MARKPDTAVVNEIAPHEAEGVHAASAPHDELAQGEVVSISQRAVATVAKGKFKVKSQITRPLLKHADHEIVYIKFLSEPYIGKEIKSTTKMAPALMVNVHNLDAGGDGEWQYILNSVLYRHKTDEKTGEVTTEGELYDAFPDGLTGHSVAIEKFPKEVGKRYNTFSVVEIEPAE